jgi:hypothetical protein
MSLMERAATLAASADGFGTGASEDVPALAVYTPMPDLNIPDPDPNGYPQIPVHLAWLRIRADIKSIGKNREYKESQQGPVKFKFRGVDDALEAFAPITLLHGVNIIPERVDASFRDARTSTGKPTRECTVTVTWRIVGPMGDSFVAQSVGESLDSGDKGSGKAQSVALRVLLFGAGLIPPNDPTVDMSTIERGEAPVRDAESYVAEVFNPATTLGRLQQIYRELVSARLRDVRVRNEIGESESVGDLVVRIGKERRASSGHVGHGPGGWAQDCAACASQSAADRELAATS